MIEVKMVLKTVLKTKPNKFACVERMEKFLLELGYTLLYMHTTLALKIGGGFNLVQDGLKLVHPL